MATTEAERAGGAAEPFVDHDEMVMCRLSAVVIDHVTEHFGDETAERLVAATGRTREELTDLHGWISYETYNRVWRAAVEVTGDEELGHRIGERALTSKALDYLLTMGRATGVLGDVGLGMRYLPDIINRSTRCVRYRALDVVGNLAVFEVTEPAAGGFVKPRCDYRASLFQALPTMAGVSPEQVTVNHTQCVGDGYPACVYEVRWVERERSLIARLWLPLAVLAAGATGALAWWAGLGPVASVLLGLLAGGVVARFGSGRAQAARLREMVTTLQQQQSQMVRAHDEVEARYHEQKQAFEALAAKTEELERTQAELVRSERLAAMGRLVAGLAHEINNPLAGILTSAELLAGEDGTPEVEERARAIIEQVERCRGLTHNMLAFGRQQPSRREPVELPRVVSSALDLAGHRLKMAEIDLCVEVDDEATDVVGDPGQLQQVILNLVENAVSALEERPRDRRLRVAVTGGAERVLIDIRDNGPGVPAGVRDRLFEPFFTTKGVGQGTGLGLSICDGIAATHGGALRVMDVPEGRGAWFQLRLPREPELPALPHSAGELVPAVSLSPARVYRILVVDDEELFRTSICRLLEQYGHRVRDVAGAAEARALLGDDEAFDVILLDLAMPGESGIECHAGLSEEQRRRVVFMTGNLGQEQGPEVEAEPRPQVLLKPFSYRELMAVVEQLVPRG